MKKNGNSNLVCMIEWELILQSPNPELHSNVYTVSQVLEGKIGNSGHVIA